MVKTELMSLRTALTAFVGLSSIESQMEDHEIGLYYSKQIDSRLKMF